MRKLFAIICDNPACRRICNDTTYIRVQGKRRELHYCSEKCKSTHTKKKHETHK